VFGALRDKDVDAVVALIDPLVLEWHLAGIHDAGKRGGGPELLAARMPGVEPARRHEHHDAGKALKAAVAASAADERVLVFGSFHTDADALRGAGGLSARV
jgi:dihydrofolate synthase/folylpolyglutamate synthase